MLTKARQGESDEEKGKRVTAHANFRQRKYKQLTNKWGKQVVPISLNSAQKRVHLLGLIIF